MDKHNIADSKSSVKVHQNPGGNSNWSLNWNEEDKNAKGKPSNSKPINI